MGKEARPCWCDFNYINDGSELNVDKIKYIIS